MHLQTQRTKCPFYGFYLFREILADQNGNQCPFKDGYFPCHMELAQQKPDWTRCSYNDSDNAKNIESFLDKTRIFPDGLHPQEVSTWTGIHLRDWYNHIVSGQEIKR